MWHCAAGRASAMVLGTASSVQGSGLRLLELAVCKSDVCFAGWRCSPWAAESAPALGSHADCSLLCAELGASEVRVLSPRWVHPDMTQAWRVPMMVLGWGLRPCETPVCSHTGSAAHLCGHRPCAWSC